MSSTIDKNLAMVRHGVSRMKEINTMKRNRELLANAKAVQTILDQFLIDNIIAGGLARDMAHGVPAKDADVCVFYYHSMDDAEATLVHKAFYELKALYPDAQWVDGCMSDGSVASFQDHQVAMVWKLPSIDVDVIFYEDCHPNPSGAYAHFRQGKRVTTPEQLVALFDSNMNQFIIENDKPKFIGSNPLEHGIFMLRNDCHKRPERINKAKAFADKHGYPFYLPL